MRPQLKDFACPATMEFICQKVEESGGNGVVIGLSGGIDSATVSKLCADAVGPDKVLNLFMPSDVSPSQDRRDVEDFCRRFDMELKVVDIGPAVKAFSTMLPNMDECRHAGNASHQRHRG